jgi:hypothetical protein
MSSSSSSSPLEEKIAILKEKIKSKEPSVQRQSIRSFVSLCQQQNNSNATRIIMKALYSMIHNESITVSSATIDAILSLCKLGLADVDKLSNSLTRYAINIHIQVLPYLTRGLMNVLVFKLQQQQQQSKDKSKKSTTTISKSLGGDVLVTLVQNRPECMPEVISQLPQLLVTKNVGISFQKILKFSSAFFTHVLTSRKLLQVDIASTTVPSFIQQQQLITNNEEVGTAQKQTTTHNFAANAMRLQLIRELIKVILQLRRQKQLNQAFILLSYLFHFVPCFNIDPADVNNSCIVPCSELIDILLILYNDHNFKEYESAMRDMLSILFNHLFSLLDDLKILKVDNEPCFSELVRILELEPAVLVQFTPIICSHILSAATELELTAYVALLDSILEYLLENTEQFYHYYTSCSKPIHSITETSIFSLIISTVLISIGPLLNVLSNASDTIQKMASATLTKLESFLNETDLIEYKKQWLNKQQEQSTASTTIVSHHLASIEPLFQRGVTSILRSHYSLINKLFDDTLSDTSLLNCKYCHVWAQGLFSNLKASSTRETTSIESPNYTCAVLGAIFVASRSTYNKINNKVITDVRSTVCDVMDLVCQVYDPVRCGLFFQPLFMFELSREQNTETRLKILSTLPKLGTKNFICVTPVVRLLSSMLSEVILTPIILRHLTQLWIENERLFPKLKASLLEKSEYQNDVTEVNPQRLSKFDIETRISIASCINTVCKHEPRKGVELISLLSKILCQENHPTVLSFGLQALYHLCISSELEFGTVWFKLVSKNIMENASRHTIVLIQMCRLLRFGIQSDIVDPDVLSEEELKIQQEKEEDEYNLFLDFDTDNKVQVKQLMETLWTYTEHREEGVREAAFEALSHYPLRAHLFILKEEQAEEEQNTQDNDSEKKEEGLFAQQEKRKILLLQFANLLMKKLNQELSNKVRQQIKHLTAMVLRAELRNPQGFKKTSTLNIPSLIVTNTVLDQITNLRVFLGGELSKKNVIDQVTTATRLWNPIGTSVHRSASDSYQRTLSDMIMDINIGGSGEDYYAHFLLVQGFFTFMARYYQAQVIEEDQENIQKAYDSAFDKIFNYLKTSIDKSTVPSRTENAILALAGLCVALPSHAHHNVEKAVTYIKEIIGSEPQEWVLFACNIGLAAASYELHVPSQISDVVECLFSQLDGFQEQDTINPASASVALGIIAKNLYVTTEESITATTTTDTFDKKLIVKIVSKLYSMCFGDSETLSFKHSTNDQFVTLIKGNINDYDWKQATNLLLGLSLAAGALTRIDELEVLEFIYDKVNNEVQKVKNSHSDNSVVIHSSLLVLPQFILSLYSSKVFTVKDVVQHIDQYKQMIHDTENKTLPNLHKIYSNSCIALATLVFSCLGQSILDNNNEDRTILLSIYETTFNYFTGTYDQISTNATTTTVKIGLQCAISCMLGLNVFVPPQLSASTTADNLGIGDSSTSKQEIAFVTTRQRSAFSSSLMQNSKEQERLEPLINKAVTLLKKFYSAKVTVDTKIRKFASYLVGIISELYTSEAEDSSEYGESENRIHLQYLNESGLSMHFIQLLTDAPETFQNAISTHSSISNNVHILNIVIALELLLSSEALPRVAWSRIIQNILKAVSAYNGTLSSSDHELKVYLIKLCFRMLCKDAQSASAKSTSLKMLSSICEKANFQTLDTDLQFELCDYLFPQLADLFPSVRTCALLTDLFQLSFNNNSRKQQQQQPSSMYITRALRRMKEEHCTDQIVSSHIKKLLSDIRREVEQTVLTQNTNNNPFISITTNVHQTTNIHKQGFAVNGSDVQMIDNFASCISSMPKQFSRELLTSEHVTTIDLMLNTLIAWHENLQNKEVISAAMKPVRQICMKSTTNPFTTQIYSTILGELISTSVSTTNAIRWLQDSLDMITFVLSEQLSPLQQALATTQLVTSSNNKQHYYTDSKKSELHMENALTFISHMSMCASTKDIYQLYFASGQIIARCLEQPKRTCADLMNTETSRLLVYALAVAFQKNILDSAVEKSLLTRLLSLLTSHPNQSITFSFIIPLLISIHHHNNKKQHVGWTVYQQIGHAIEKKALKLASALI